MRALMINAVCGIRSTGRICTDLAKELETEGYEVKIAYGRATVPEQFQQYAVRIGGSLGVCWHALMSKAFDQRGNFSKRATKQFLKWADEYDPDLLWLHNIHDYFINIEMLFDWIKSRPNMQVKWTMHDCWAFTGGCMHFVLKNCYQWKTACQKCPLRSQRKLNYSEKKTFLRKKEAFTGVSKMTIIAVSNWIANLVKESFLKNYPIEVRHNTIDTSIFKPTHGDFRERYCLEEKTIVLGVASAWSASKGLFDFVKLSEQLDPSYQIVLVGLSPKQIAKMPKNILCISRTNSTKELAEIYTAADVFVNPSREETFGLTTLEALSCGTPAIVYKNTACEEVVNMYSGIAVEQSVDALLNAIKQII